MKTKPTFIGTIVALLIILAFYNDGFSQTCATCPENTVTGIKASAFGKDNTASGNYSFVAGRNSIANQSNAVVIGSDSRASGGHSYVIGSTTFALGNFSYAFGGNSTSESDFSLVLGHNLISRNGAFVIGKGNVDAKLTNNSQETLMIGFNSAYPTLFVSRTESGKQSGRVGIGNVTDPQAKLHIKADATEEASLRLEPTSSTYNAVVYFTNSGHAVKAKTGGHLTFNTQSTKGFVFETGNMGIGVAAPSEKLDVAGNIKQSAGSSLTTSTIKAADANGLKLHNSSGNGVFVSNTGSVGIGTTNTAGYLLAVAGKVVATEVFVKHIDNWYDHVFSENYALMSIIDLEKFINENKHLPDIPTENEVLTDGIQLGNIAGLLLKKIEELTLYTIQQQKLIEQQQETLEKVLESLKEVNP